MDVKQAVATAKAYYIDVIGETPSVEEIWFDEPHDEWCVTLGRRRMIKENALSVMGVQSREVIDYKVVRISDKDGKALSIRNRDIERAA